MIFMSDSFSGSKLPLFTFLDCICIELVILPAHRFNHSSAAPFQPLDADQAFSVGFLAGFPIAFQSL